VFEKATWIGVHGIDGERQSGRGIADSIIENEEPRARKSAFTRASRKSIDAEAYEHVFQKLIIILDYCRFYS